MIKAPLRRSGWVLADYGVSAATNMLLTVMVARNVTRAEFGVFAVLYGYYVLVVELSRATFSEPLLVRASTASHPSRRLADSAGAAAVFGAVAAMILVPLSVLLRGGLDSAALVLAMALPGLLVQDALRVGFIAIGQGAKSLANDLFWGATQVAALVLLFTAGAGLVWALAAWAGAGLAAAALAMAQARVMPRCTAVRGWWRDYGRLSRPYAVEVAVIATAAYAGTLAVGVVAGVAAVGALRAGNTLLGPVGLVCAAGRTIAISECRRAIARSPDRLVPTMLVIGGSLAAVAVCWGLVILSLPPSLGGRLVGSSWTTARAVLPPLVAVQFISAVVMTMGGAMRALEAVREQFTLRILGGALAFLGPTVGAAWSGAFGAAVGLATLNALGCALTFLVFVRVLARRRANALHSPGSLLPVTEQAEVS
jgi:O-antigen/teichoic acid export membrane protein